ncbi:serine-rich adhesin for platelets-like [Littorina saxatilis]|uniref:serine-rich adhesin for platelets-like n=1 Tax=Littorina saxatilis TaxID=31220 RepID=UPI0038B42572
MAKDDDDQSKPSESNQQQQGKPKRQLPYGWIVRVSKSHPDRVFYFNTVTGASTWELPDLVETEPSSSANQSEKPPKKENSIDPPPNKEKVTHQPPNKEKPSLISPKRECLLPFKKAHSSRKLDLKNFLKQQHLKKVEQLKKEVNNVREEDQLDLSCDDTFVSSSNLDYTSSSSDDKLESWDSDSGLDSGLGEAALAWSQHVPKRGKLCETATSEKVEEKKTHWTGLWDSPNSDPRSDAAATPTSDSDCEGSAHSGLTEEELKIIRSPIATLLGKKYDSKPTPRIQSTSQHEIVTRQSDASQSQSTIPTSASWSTNLADVIVNQDMNMGNSGSNTPGCEQPRTANIPQSSPLSSTTKIPYPLQSLLSPLLQTNRSPTVSKLGQAPESRTTSRAYSPPLSPAARHQRAASSPLQTGEAVTVEFRTGVKRRNVQKTAVPGSPNQAGGQSLSKKVKENLSAPNSVVELRQGLHPISPSGSEKKKAPSTDVSSVLPKVVERAPFIPRVLTSKPANSAVSSSREKETSASMAATSRPECLPQTNDKKLRSTGDGVESQLVADSGDTCNAPQTRSSGTSASTDISGSRKRRLKRLLSDVDSIQFTRESSSAVQTGSSASPSNRLSDSTAERTVPASQLNTAGDQESKARKMKTRSKAWSKQQKASSSPDALTSELVPSGTCLLAAQSVTSPSHVFADTVSISPLANPSLCTSTLEHTPPSGFPSVAQQQLPSVFNLQCSAHASDLKQQRLSGEICPPGFFGTQNGNSTLSGVSSATVGTTLSGPLQANASGMGATAFPISPAFTLNPVASKSPVAAQEGAVAMEVDDDDDQIMMDLQEFREKFKPDINAKAMGMLTESVQQAQTTRPVSPVQGLPTASKLVYLVVDTNVLIGSLKFVQKLRDMALKDYGRPYLVIPWIVLQELDSMKGSRFRKMSHEKKAQDAVRYLHSCLVSQHPRVRGQTPEEASEQTNKLDVQCNDDLILQCCVQYQKKYVGAPVILLTDDLNLVNKSVVMGIKCFSTKTLAPQLTEVTVECPSPQPTPTTTGSAENTNGPSASRAFQGHPTTSRSSPALGRNDSQTGETAQSTDVTGQQQREQRILTDELLCGAKSVLRSSLSPLVEKEMKEAFGNLWSDVVYKKPPWSAHDLALILQKHWIAVFGQKMDRRLKNPIEHLANQLRPETATQLTGEKIQELLSNSLQLVRGAHRLSPCEEAVKQLEKLGQKAQTLQPNNLTDMVGSSSASQSGKSATNKGTNNDTTTTNNNINNMSSSQSANTGAKPSRRRQSSAASVSSHSSSSSSSVGGGRRISTEMIEEPSLRTQQERRESQSPQGTESSQAGMGISPLLRDNANQQHTSGVVERWIGEPSVKRGRHLSQSGEATVTSPGDTSRNNNSVGNSSAASSDINAAHQIQIPKMLSSEEAASIGQLFQEIWSAIFNCCNNVGRLLVTPMSDEEIDNITETLTLLVPLVKQIRSEFGKCLSFSPVGLERHMDTFFAFSSCLNNFFVLTKIPSPPLAPVTPGNMIAFMTDTKNRVTLFNGLRQLDDMIVQLHNHISRLPD